MRFVIQEHYATTHHFDFRLEHDGVLWSWAVPKGMPTHPKGNRLAVRVDDHDLDHIDYEDHAQVEGQPAGVIAKSIWDHGTYDMVRADERKLVFDLVGQRLNGRYSLFQTGGTQWMIHLMEGAAGE